MSNQQPHTPNISDFREDFVTACVHSYWLRADRARDYFNRELAAIEAAAEQRGAIKALRDTADHIENEIEFVLPNRYKPLRFRRNYEQDGTGLTPEEWLRARADQMEGDDE